jgi:hypothetical protein
MDLTRSHLVSSGSLISLFIYSSIHLSVHPSIYLFIYSLLNNAASSSYEYQIWKQVVMA